MLVSVIIPTRNRSNCLRKAIASVQQQDYPSEDYEIIVVDNGSTDDTADVVSDCDRIGTPATEYYKEPRLGLHNARHAGAKRAKGRVLVYIDDDIICDQNWLLELVKPFADPNVVCVGGKIVPRYETKEPRWARCFPGFLSILDRGSEIKKVNDIRIWGCNFSIKKSTLYEIGGFHPDAMPWSLIRYRGDGENGILNKVVEKGYDVVYTPFALVTHIIPKERVGLAYFKKRAFFQGISDSYTEMRKNGGLPAPEKGLGLFNSAISGFRLYVAYSKILFGLGSRCPAYEEIARRYHHKGVNYHVSEVSKDKNLLEFVLQENYLENGHES